MRHTCGMNESERFCEECTTLFFSNHPLKRFCSERCKVRAEDRRRSHASKKEAYELLGNKCAHCGFDDARALQIDHVDGGGKKELTNIGNRRVYYKRIIALIKSGSKKKYQLLCANCNWIKRHVDNEK